MDRKHIKDLVKKTVYYNLPLIEGYHAHKKLEITPQNRKFVYKNFGLNYFDIIYSGILQKSKFAGFGLLDIGNLHIDYMDCPGIMLMNCSRDIIVVKNEENGDIYTIEPFGTVNYNTYGQDIISAKVGSTTSIKKFVRNSKRSRRQGQGQGFGFKKGNQRQRQRQITTADLIKTVGTNSVWMHCIKFGHAYYVFLKFEDIINGIVSPVELPVYRSILLCSGIINEDIYSRDTSLNWYLKKASYDENNNMYFDDQAFMQQYIELLTDQWETVNPAIVEPNKNPRIKLIPHRIHWIWLSYKVGSKYKESPPSSVVKFEQFMKTWIIRNPTFEFNIWTNNSKLELPASIASKIIIRNLDDINNTIELLKGTKLKKNYKIIDNIIHNHQNVGIRSDTLRQTILYTLGGVYADVNDMACLVPFETFLNTFDFFCGLEPMMYPNNAIIGSRKGHKIPERFLDSIVFVNKEIFEDYPELLEHYKNKEDEDNNKDDIDNFVVSHTGPIAFSGVIYGFLSDAQENKKSYDRTCIFPSKFLYSNYEITEESSAWLSPFSLTAHYDARSFR